MFNYFKYMVKINRMSDSEGKEKTREKILQAAKREFAEKGFAGTKLDAVARRAGINKALVHYYFTSKEELYRQVHVRFFGMGTQRELLLIFPPVVLTPSQKLYIVLYYLIKIHLQMRDRDLFRILFWDILEGSSFHIEATREHRVPQARLLERIICEGIDTGEFLIDNPRLFVMFILSFMDMYVMESEVYGEKEIFQDLYGNCSDDEILTFTLHAAFKTLRKSGEVNIPEITQGIMEFVDEIVEKVVQDTSQGYFTAAFEKIVEEMTRSS